jgi:hypothetical protein
VLGNFRFLKKNTTSCAVALGIFKGEKTGIYVDVMKSFRLKYRSAECRYKNEIKQQKGSTNHQPQLKLYQFYCLLHVSALVKSHYQAVKNTLKNN